jgi:type IV pilus assembly protein PilM
MTPFISSPQSIGLERSGTQIRAAAISWHHQKPQKLELFILQEEENVKQLYIQHPLLVTGLEGYDVLVRSLTLPLVKEGDIQAALAFQAEPLLPYPIDQALLAYQRLSQTNESSHLTLIAARKDAVQSHLDWWHAQQIEPEQIASIPSALTQFGMTYIETDKPFIILHIELGTLTGVLIKNKKLIASFSQTEGFDSFLTTQSTERLQQQATKVAYVLFKELNGEPLEGVLLTGTVMTYPMVCEQLAKTIQWPLLTSQSVDSLSSVDLQIYAVPIGLALGSILPGPTCIDFRQQEWLYPYPWSRLKQTLMIYAAAMCLLTTLFYFFSQAYLRNEEHQLKQSYVDLLTNRNKVYDQFELAFLEKNPEAREKSDGEVVPVEKLNQQDLIERLNFFQKEVQAAPESFPLFANTPRVSDVLAWLAQHPVIAYQDETGQWLSRLKIENFSYVMVKRPVQSKKQEKYQVKIELELSSSTPKWAREFHDALIAPNDWVDPKSEVKWSSNRGKYKTSFYLKDKTLYPSL